MTSPTQPALTAPDAARQPSAVAASAGPDRHTARTARSGYLVWGLLGFLLGAVFWHVVGFWDFLGGIVYRRQQEATLFERALVMGQMLAEEDRPLAEREQHARAAAQNCTTLVLDRLSGTTSSRPCVVIIRNVPQDEAASSPSAVLKTSARLDMPATKP